MGSNSRRIISRMLWLTTKESDDRRRCSIFLKMGKAMETQQTIARWSEEPYLYHPLGHGRDRARELHVLLKSFCRFRVKPLTESGNRDSPNGWDSTCITKSTKRCK